MSNTQINTVNVFSYYRIPPSLCVIVSFCIKIISFYKLTMLLIPLNRMFAYFLGLFLSTFPNNAFSNTDRLGSATSSYSAVDVSPDGIRLVTAV